MVPSDRMRSNGHKMKHRRFPPNIRKHCFHCEGNQAHAKVAQRGFGVAILEDLQKLSGYGPGQRALGGPA